ncbi:hypothetical protein BJX99DRAFT_165954 [Aspergillus californicus]
MRILSIACGLLLAGSAVAQNSTGCSPTSSDNEVVRYTWALQSLLERFYASQPINQTFLGNATNSSRTESYYRNFQGIQRESRLGVRAVQQIGSRLSNFSSPTCNFTYPNATDAEGYVRTALRLESSVASALIGAAGYTRSPEVSFLLSRLASQHTAGATWLATQQSDSVFQPMSGALVPAYNPSYVLSTSGDQPGKLGRYLRGCVRAPVNLCGQQFFIGPLIGTIGEQGSETSSSSSSAISPTAAARNLFGS